MKQHIKPILYFIFKLEFKYHISTLPFLQYNSFVESTEDFKFIRNKLVATDSITE